MVKGNGPLRHTSGRAFLVKFMKHIRIFFVLCLASISAIGQVVQPVSTVSGPTVTASSAYSSGMCVGGVFSFNAPVGSEGGTSLLESIRIWDSDFQSEALVLLIFNTDPTVDGWTLTDHSAAVAPAAPTEIPSVVSIQTGDWLPIGTIVTIGLVTVSDLRMPTDSAIGQSKKIFAAFVTTSTPTFTTTTSLKIRAFFNISRQ